MSYTIQDLKTDLEAALHGTSLNKIQNINGLIDRAGRELLGDADLNGTIRSQVLTNPIYSRVYNYVLPSDLKGKKVIDIKPQVNRGASDNFRGRGIKDFDMRKSDETFNIDFDSGERVLRASTTTGKNVTLSNLNSTTNWSTGSDAENLTADSLNYVSEGSSLNFDLSGDTTAGYIENSSLDSLDLSDYEDNGAIFIYVYFPDSSIMTSVNVRWGNDNTAYWNRTVTTNNEGNSFHDGWNLLRLDWNGATETGTTDSSTVDYARITINYDGTAETDIRVDSLVVRLGSIYDIVYYSKYMFQSATTETWAENVALDSDVINVETNEINLMIDKTTELAAAQQAGVDSQFDVAYYSSKYANTLSKYKSDNKSQAIKEQQEYYRI